MIIIVQRKEQLKEVCKAIDRSTKRDVLEKVNKVEEDIMYWEEQIKNWDGQIKLHEKALKQCKKKGKAAHSYTTAVKVHSHAWYLLI